MSVSVTHIMESLGYRRRVVSIEYVISIFIAVGLLIKHPKARAVLDNESNQSDTNIYPSTAVKSLCCMFGYNLP